MNFILSIILSNYHLSKSVTQCSFVMLTVCTVLDGDCPVEFVNRVICCRVDVYLPVAVLLILLL